VIRKDENHDKSKTFGKTQQSQRLFRGNQQSQRLLRETNYCQKSFFDF
jgi:hypothetical protein